MKNYSKQREAILQVLRSTDTHPTAAEVYNRVRAIIPNISLGTVYRNLAELSSCGDALNISVGDGFEHYDGDTAPHIHLYCKKCGSIIDARLETDLLNEVIASYDFTPESTSYVVSGICSKCKAMIKI